MMIYARVIVFFLVFFLWGLGGLSISVASGAVPMLAAMILLLMVFYQRKCVNNNEYVLTSRRLVMKTGVLQVSTSELPYDKIESVLVTQGISGRMLDYGTVVVIGLGGTQDTFRMIKRPYEFRKMIQELAAKKTAS